jgi:hypothetical protein
MTSTSPGDLVNATSFDIELRDGAAVPKSELEEGTDQARRAGRRRRGRSKRLTLTTTGVFRSGALAAGTQIKPSATSTRGRSSTPSCASATR